MTVNFFSRTEQTPYAVSWSLNIAKTVCKGCEEAEVRSFALKNESIVHVDTVNHKQVPMCTIATHIKLKGKSLNDIEPFHYDRADGKKGNVSISNVLNNVVLDLIHFNSAYWHIQRLCHLRSLMGAGDSLIC